MLRLFFSALSLLALAFFLAPSCMREEGAKATIEALPPTHWFELKIEAKSIRVQLVINRKEMARGLMERTELQPDEGMLFVYPRPRQASFWMKNTPLPLDIGFFNPAGVLLEVYRLFPYDETSVPSRSDQVQFALEMNQGWFSRNEVRPGAALDLKSLRQALEARGADPAEYGL